MDFSKEPWRRIYINESIDHRAMPLLSRGLRDYLVRVARQEDGVLVKNEPTKERAIETLLRGCAAHPDELKTCTDFILDWLKDGYLVWRTRHKRYSLVILSHVDAQNARSPGARRMRRLRQRRKASLTDNERKKLNETKQLSLVTSNVTSDVTGDNTSDVTGDVTPQETVTSQRKKERKKEKKETKKEIRARALSWRDTADGQFEHDPPHLWNEVQQVLEYSDQTWSTLSRVANSADPRVKVVVDRLCDGFTVDDLCEAIRGSTRSKFIQEHSDLQCVKTLLKSAADVDKYSRLLAAPSAAPTVQPDEGSGYYDTTGFEEDEKRGPTKQLAPDDPFQKSKPKVAGKK